MDLRDEYEEIEEFLPSDKMLPYYLKKNEDILESCLRYMNQNDITMSEFFKSIESHIKQAKDLNKLLNKNKYF